MTSPEIVVLISAETEWRAVKPLFNEIVTMYSPFGEWFFVNLQIAETKKPIIFFHGGWGKISAAASTQYAIDKWSPKLLVNLGTCGGFEGKIERFSILLVDKTIVYDIVEQMGDPEEAVSYYSTNVDLSWLGENYPIKVIKGALLSGDKDLIADDMPVLQAKYDAIVGDWESGAIAWVAARNGIRCLILRGVTDLVGKSGGEAYGRFDIFVNRARKVMKYLIESLPNWLTLAISAREYEKKRRRMLS